MGMIKYIEPSSTVEQAQLNWFNSMKNWVEDNHIIVPVAGLVTSLITPITTLASIFDANREEKVSQSVAGQRIGAALTTYLTVQMMADMAVTNAGWGFTFTPLYPIDLTSPTKEGMFEKFSAWLTAGALTATNSSGTSFACTFQRL